MELRWSQTLVRDQREKEAVSHLHVDQLLRRDMVGLERRLAEYVGVDHCICVDSATSGMLMALRACGVGRGDAVFCTSFSYFAIAEIIQLAGAVPVFVDINPNTLCIDSYCLEYVIGKCQRTRQPVPKALVAVDLFGLPCNYEELEEICQRHSIQLIEDMALSIGATFRGKQTGGFGRMAVASFFPAKPLGELGEGGAVFCADQGDAQQLQRLRYTNHGQADSAQRRSSHLDAVQTSVVSEKLKSFDHELERRQAIAEQYTRRLAGAVRIQQVPDGHASAYTHYAILLRSAERREEIVERLQLAHVPCQVYEPSPVRRDRESNWDKVSLVNARSVAQRILTLPIHPYLSPRVVDYICDRVIEAVQETETGMALQQA